MTDDSADEVRGADTDLERTRPARELLARVRSGQVLVLAKDLRIAAATRGALAFFAADDLVSIRALWDAEVRPLLARLLARESTAQGATDERAVVLRPDELPVPAPCVLEWTSLAAGSDGEAFLASITRLDELDELGALLESSDRAASFAAVHDALVHDLRAPLNSVVLAAQLLEGELLESGATVEHEYVDTLGRELARFRRLFEILLEAVRPPGELEEAAPIAPIALAALGRDVAALVTAVADARGVRLVLAAPEPASVDPREHVAADRLRHAVTTLGLRVLDRLPRGGQLTVEVIEEADRSVLRVTGSAAASEHGAGRESRANEADPRGRRVVDGLLVARAIVSDLGGRLRELPEAAGASGFVIELPCARGSRGEVPATR